MRVKVKITETRERVVSVKARNKTDAVANATRYILDDNRTIKDSGLVYFKVELYEDEQKDQKEN